jgi:hypothetical protein
VRLLLPRPWQRVPRPPNMETGGSRAITPEHGNELPPPNVGTSSRRAITPEHGNARPDRGNEQPPNVETRGYHESAGCLIGPPGASYSCHSGENCPRP